MGSFYSAREKYIDGKPYKKIINDLYHFSKNGKDSKGELLKTTLKFLYRLNCLFYGDFKRIEKADYYKITCESLLIKQVELIEWFTYDLEKQKNYY